MKIIVTGAIGHIGSYIIRDLGKNFPGADIIMIDNMMTQRFPSLFNLPSNAKYHFIEGDVSQMDLKSVFVGANVVIHLAAITDAAGSIDKAEELEANNYQSTLRVAKACIEVGARLIALSSTSVYGTQKDQVDENCSEIDLQPQSPYATTKLKEEELITNLVNKEGLKAIHCRFGTIFGASPGMRFHTAVNKFCWQAVMGQPITVWTTAYDQKRPYLDLLDASRAIDYIIKNNIVLPYGIDLRIEADTKIKIGHKKSLLVYGGLNINGTINLPVVITSIDNNKPFGALAAIGSNQTSCSISFLDISNGSESEINGSFLSGALSLYSHKKVVIKNSKVHNNFADDGLNIKTANVEIDNSQFYANFADQVDLDFTNAIIKNSLFKVSNEDGNVEGDGLDLSGSKAIIMNSNFDNFADKGISVGESTQIFIYNNNFVNNRSAVTGKDGSTLYFYQNKYKNNLLDIEAYVKKPIYNSPSLYVLNEEHISDQISIENNSEYFLSKDDIKISGNINFDIISMLNNIKWKSVKMSVER